MNPARLLIGVFLAVLLLTPTLAQQDDDTCPGIVEAALTMTADVCDGTGRDNACVGHINLNATPRPDITNFTFAQPGDLAALDAIESLQMGPMDTVNRTWGVSLLRLQANLNNANQAVTMIVFGGVEVTNAVETLPTVEITPFSGMNVRQLPSTSSAIVGSLTGGETVSANGRSEDDAWLRVALPQNQTGWVFASLVDVVGDVSTLVVSDSAASTLTPMQAFYIESGFDDPVCAEAIPDGVLIQTPENATERVRLVVNDAEVLLGSTAYLRAERDGVLRVWVVEGQAEVTVGDTSEIIPAGTYTDVPLDDLSASGPPETAQPYTPDDVTALPVDLLPETITVAEPMDADAITAAAPGAAAGAAAAPGSTMIVVDGNAGWVDTGVQLVEGQTVVITASGVVNVWAECETESVELGAEIDCGSLLFGPDGGVPTFNGVPQPVNAASFPEPGLMFHSLVGRIDDGEAFQVGSNVTLVAETAGTFYLRVNDGDASSPDDIGWNSGAFTAVISALPMLDSAAGEWFATDRDGSSMTLTVSVQDNTAAVYLYDDGATACSTDGGATIPPAEGSGTGVMQEDGSVTVTLEIVCTESGENKGRYLTVYTYDAAADTLTDGEGVVWTRAGG